MRTESPTVAARPVLEERARRLARAQESTPSPTRPMLTFRIGPERYGILAEHVASVLRLRQLTPLPSAPREVAGLTTWRGRYLTVLDLERVLGIERVGLDDRVWVVELLVDQTRIGLLATRLGEVVEVDPVSINTLEGCDAKAALGRTDEALLVLDARVLAGALERGGES